MWVKVLCALGAIVSVAAASYVLPGSTPISIYLPKQNINLVPPTREKPSVTEKTQIVESFHVKSDIRYRFSTTQISSVVRNIGEEAQEIGFDVTLPKEAFIMDFYMTIDGKRINGTVMKKEAAKKTYQEAVNRGQSAGHVRQAPRHANVFQVSYNVRAGKSVNFTLTYQELLRRRLGVYEHEIFIKPGQIVEDFQIEVRVLENRPLKFIRTPALKTDDLLRNEIPLSEDEVISDVTIVDRPTPETATILYKPSLHDQEDTKVPARFIVQYDVEHAGVGGDILTVDGYFIHFISPDEVASQMPKDIIFVIDVSGSMHGQKIQQLKDSMKKILSDLLPQDRLNIITFGSNVDKWKAGLVTANESTIAEANEFVREMQADGLTNINDALLLALKEMHEREDKERVAMIFFLTDGMPTSGETNPKAIAKNVADANERTVAIFSLAYGSGADYKSLKSLSAQNLGFARKIYEASDAALQVATLYNEISAVSIKDMSVSYQNSSDDEFTVTETEFPLVFTGSERVICGFKGTRHGTFRYRVRGMKRSGVIDYTTEIDLDDVTLVIPEGEETDSSLFTGPRDYAGFIERVWAFLTIKQLLIKKLQNAGDEIAIEQLNTKILDLSLKYKFVTPLTSMVVAEPNKDVKELNDVTDTERPEARRTRPKFSKSQLRQNSLTRQMSPSKNLYKPNLAFDPSASLPKPMSGRKILRKPKSRGGRRKSGKSNLKKVTPSGTPPTVHLITFGMSGQPEVLNTTDICVLPKRWGFPQILLLTGPNNIRIVLDQCRRRRKCQSQPDSVLIEAGSDKTAVYLGTNTTWRYNSTSGFDVTISSNTKLEITHQAAKIIVEIEHTTANRYILRIGAAPGKYGGLLGETLQLPETTLRKINKKRSRRACKAESSKWSVVVSKKKARKFSLRGKPKRKNGRKASKRRGRAQTMI